MWADRDLLSLVVRHLSVLLRCRQIEKKEREAKLQERAEVQFLPQAGSETGRVCQQQASC